MISSTGEGARYGRAVSNIQVNIRRGEKRVKANLNGMMEVFMKENSLITIFMVLVSINGPMVVSISENGSITKCVVSAPSPGQMVDAISDSIKRIKRMAMEPFFGQTCVCMRANGRMGDRKELDIIL